MLNNYILHLKYLFILCFVVCCGIACSSPANDKTPPTALANDTTASLSDALPSWTDGPTKKRIVDYISDITKAGSPDFIPVSERNATFDNDGTLWSEQPIYFQLFYVLDRIKAMAPKHSEWKNQQPYKAILDNNMGEILPQFIS
jgi:hypothetical protein